VVLQALEALRLFDSGGRTTWRSSPGQALTRGTTCGPRFLRRLSVSTWVYYFGRCRGSLRSRHGMVRPGASRSRVGDKVGGGNVA
jgi:hypothetical protein